MKIFKILSFSKYALLNLYVENIETDWIYNHRFNLIRFSGSCSVWRDAVQPPTEANCHDAIRWVSHLVAGGNTCTLEALQVRDISRLENNSSLSETFNGRN